MSARTLSMSGSAMAFQSPSLEQSEVLATVEDHRKYVHLHRKSAEEGRGDRPSFLFL